ncbi:MAG: hypothetical protein IBJ10_01230 [Phycisphaerales bacterium]|nr:hypothetical protein [Phycisphaerales bacterium]
MPITQKSAFAATYTLVSWEFPTDCPAAVRRAKKWWLKHVGRAPGHHGNYRTGMALVCRPFDKFTAEALADVPADGEVRCVPVTDAQVRRGQNAWGARRGNLAC